MIQHQHITKILISFGLDAARANEALKIIDDLKAKATDAGEPTDHLAEQWSEAQQAIEQFHAALADAGTETDPLKNHLEKIAAVTDAVAKLEVAWRRTGSSGDDSGLFMGGGVNGKRVAAGTQTTAAAGGWGRSLAVKVREHDFMREERRPFKGADAIGEGAADQLVLAIGLANQFGAAELADDLAAVTLREQVFQFHTPPHYARGLDNGGPT